MFSDSTALCSEMELWCSLVALDMLSAVHGQIFVAGFRACGEDPGAGMYDIKRVIPLMLIVQEISHL